MENVEIAGDGGDRNLDLNKKRKLSDEEEKKPLKSDETENKNQKPEEEDKDMDEAADDEDKEKDEVEDRDKAVYDDSSSDDPSGDDPFDTDSEFEDLPDEEFDDGDEVGEEDETSNFTKEQVRNIKVKPEEYHVELDEEEKKYYTSFEYQRGGGYVENKVPKGSYVYHFATKEEMKELTLASRKSQEFDIPLLPGVVPTCLFRINLSKEATAIHVAQMSKCALMYYNNKHKTDYALQRIVKSNGRPCAVLVYCTTFLATSKSADHTITTFQAKVWLMYTGDIHVMMCRIKPDDDQPQL